ncbi:serine O-acetyltransferase, partial [Vibrio rhizosphaerae]|uniref:Serine acetyltransferase n=1 Tax=Vibrio rhizosphaerae TaxID=398736 RepID=A0ABU4IRR3_9VIBR
MLNHIRADVFRWYGRYSTLLLVKAFLSQKGFRFVLLMRLAKHSRHIPGLNLLFILLYKVAKIIYTSDVNYRASIGPGLRMHHVFGTTWGEHVTIGRNATIVHNVTIAGKNGAWPTIGDNVYLGSGCCILGGIRIGDNVVVGANAVVTKDVPDHAIVAGIPAKVVSEKGSAELMVNPWSD